MLLTPPRRGSYPTKLSTVMQSWWKIILCLRCRMFPFIFDGYSTIYIFWEYWWIKIDGILNERLKKNANRNFNHANSVRKKSWRLRKTLNFGEEICSSCKRDAPRVFWITREAKKTIKYMLFIKSKKNTKSRQTLWKRNGILSRGGNFVQRKFVPQWRQKKIAELPKSKGKKNSKMTRMLYFSIEILKKKWMRT